MWWWKQMVMLFIDHKDLPPTLILPRPHDDSRNQQRARYESLPSSYGHMVIYKLTLYPNIVLMCIC